MSNKMIISWSFLQYIPENVIVDELYYESIKQEKSFDVFDINEYIKNDSILESTKPFAMFTNVSMSIFDKIFNEEDLDNYEAVNIQELMINASRGNAANADRGDTSKYDRFINSIETLTPMESQVFELYCKDFSPKEVADELKISINTVKSHNRKIYEKLGAANKAELQSLIRMMKDSN